MNKDDYHFSTILGCEDDIDKKINFHTMGMVMGLNVSNFILSDKARWDDYATRVIEIGTSLQKANGHLRKYKVEEKIFLSDFLKKHLDTEQNTHSSTTAVNLTSELDSFLTQYKSTLDTLSKTFEPLFGVKFKTWGKKKDTTDGKEKSGLKIIDGLNRNVSDAEKIKIEPLTSFIKNNLNWITYNVNLRDSSNHYGGLKNISNVFYNYKEKRVYPQTIKHNEEFTEIVTDYMERTIQQLIDYVTMVLILSLEAKAPGNDMFIQQNTESEFPPFRWMVKLPKKKDNKL